MTAVLLSLLVLGATCDGSEVVVLVLDPDIERTFADDISLELIPAVRRMGASPCSNANVVGAARVNIFQIDKTHVRINVENVESERSVQRDVSLAGLPQDMRGLTIAQLAEDMLRGSWWSVIHPPAPEPGPVVAEPVPEPTPPPPPPTDRLPPPPFAISAGFRAVAYSGDVRSYGPMLGVRWMPTSILRLSLEGGYGFMDGLEGANGDVSGTMPWSAIAAGLVYAPSSRFELYGELVGRGSIVRVRGRPDVGAEGSRESGGLFEAGVRLGLARKLFAGLQVVASIEGGTVLRAVDVRDDGDTLASASGGYVAGMLGLAWAFGR